MNERSPLRTLVVLVVVPLVVVACTAAATPSASPSRSSVPASSSVAPASASIVPTSSPSPSPSDQACGPSPCSSPAPSAAACPSPDLAVRIAADRLVDVRVVVGPTEDRVTFVLSASTTPSPATPAVTLAVVAPPFVADPSGLPLQAQGSRFLRVRFEGMTLFDAAGVSSYSGSTSIAEPGPGLRAVVQQSAFEGVTAWIVGYDSAACATASGDASSVMIAISHP